jgi:F-type H+-transporting ATPase subunit alpha
MLNIKESVIKEIEKRVSEYDPSFKSVNVGLVSKIGDEVAVVTGLTGSKMGEVVVFENGATGLILNLKKSEVGVIIFSNYEGVKEGDRVESTGEILSITASDAYLGRVINPLGDEIDGKGKIIHKKDLLREMLVERIAPGIIDRDPVDTPLQTGIKAIDSMIPVGRGQRELIIGDRSTGKTAVAIDAIINQEKLNKEILKNGKNVKSGQKKRVISIYVAIGQKQSKISQLVSRLESMGAFENVIIVAANSSDPTSLQFIAPYSASSIAEYFMEKGEDVLIVYDDLSKHAWAYRQISLVLRRPSGREAYPGDIFYLHSRLLERSCKLSKARGGGSITALPIIETQAQDISAYIPTNVISITDGQIYLEPDLFYQGVRPAINAGLSVSRVGGAAQLKAVKKITGKMRLDIAQFNELSSFAQFGSDLDAGTKAKLDRGQRIVEILKQPQYEPVSIEEQTLVFWLVTNGYLDQTPVNECLRVSRDFAKFYLSKDKTFADKILAGEAVDGKMEENLKNTASTFFKK